MTTKPNTPTLAELPASNLQIAKGISLIEEMRRESMSGRLRKVDRRRLTVLKAERDRRIRAGTWTNPGVCDRG